jgi:hypothetical protein
VDPIPNVAEYVTDELLLLRQKVQQRLADSGAAPDADAEDAYVSAVIGHLFAALLSGLRPALAGIDRSPEALAAALTTIGKKVSVIAENLDSTANYRIQILRREKTGA